MARQEPGYDGGPEHRPPGDSWHYQASGAPEGGWQPQPGAQRPRATIRRRASRRAPAHRWARWAIEARPLAMVLGVLAVLGLLGATLGFTVDLFVAPGRIFTRDAEDSLHVAASLIGLGGAFELHRGSRSGKRLVLASLAFNLAATLWFGRATIGRVETQVAMLTWIVLAVLTVLARPAREPESPSSRPGPDGSTGSGWYGR